MTYYFEAVTTYDKRSLREFTKYHYRHVAPALPVLLLLLGAAALPLGIFQKGGLTMAVAGAVLLVFGANLLLGRFSAGAQDAQENRIRFFDDRVEYAGRQEQGYYTYSQVIRLRENSKYFFLYVAKNRALLVEKARMTLGSPEQLRLFLREKLPQCGEEG